ncbi:MAG: hypothetical protein ACFB0G_11040 [Leptolyngbyaceae cyanobacterium]
MTIELGCLEDSFDRRDYAWNDAVQVLSQERADGLYYAFFNYGPEQKKDNEETGYVGLVRFDDAGQEYDVPDQSTRDLSLFHKYEIKNLPAQDRSDITASTVLIPLKPQGLQEEVEFTLELNQRGEIVLKDSGNIVVGNVVQEQGRVFVQNSSTGEPIQGKLIIRQDGRVAVRSSQEKIHYLYLGSGFRKFELDQNRWSPVEQQMSLLVHQGQNRVQNYPDVMCAANAGVALLEYFERISTGQHLNASRLFLHQVACKLRNVPYTSGVSIRDIVKAMSKFGVPPEEYWSYDPSRIMEEPPAFCYAYAQNYRARNYLRLDRPQMDKAALIAQIKILTYSGLPIIFGFSLYDSIEQSFEENNLGCIPFPTYGEIRAGGHAAVIAGYDDDKLIENHNPIDSQRDRYISCDECQIKLGEVALSNDKVTTRGAFKVRNSWGRQWGEQGYGWLPYAYVFEDYAFDFWTILKFEWMNRDDFGLKTRGDDLFQCASGKKPPYC